MSGSISDFIKINDDTDVKTWLKTDAVTGSFFDNGFRVTWIDWNSDFRNSDLRIEDVIVGYDDVSFAPFLKPGKHGSAIGQHGETTYWQKLDAKHGQIIKLKIIRQGVENLIEIPGKLLARRFYTDIDGKRSLGPGGPPKMSTDGFSGSWASWYEKFVSKASYILDGGWDRKKINNRRELDDHNEYKTRIDYLTKTYPGSFADTVFFDWQNVYSNLLGKQIDDIDLEYREIGAKRVEIVKQEAQKAWDEIHSELSEKTISAFPVIDVDDRELVKDKIIDLPRITPRNIINDLGQTYAVIGNRIEGFYFVQLSDSVSVRKFYDAMYQYQSQINPKLRESYQYVGKITGEPALITYDGKAVTGLMVEIIAARAGDGEFFVDLRNTESKINFAGHDKLNHFAPILIDDKSLPHEIIEAMIEAVKLAHQETWKTLFATWRASKYWEDHIAFDPSYSPTGAFSSAWKRSREMISNKLYDVRIDKTNKIRRIIKKNTAMGFPDVDEVDVFVDHYELIDGVYRSFLDNNVRRKWTLQRLNQGPWRITTVQVI